MLVPEGPFELGLNEDDPTPEAGMWSSSLGPRHTVTLSAYCIQRTETTVAQYRACVEAGACELPYRTDEQEGWCNYTLEPGIMERHPVNCIDWHASRAFCQWVGGDLPTEAQWEKAARGTDQRFFPWGNELGDCSRANYDQDGYYSEGPDGPVGEGMGCLEEPEWVTWEAGHLTSGKGDSPYGVRDMAGNVGEWVLDCDDPGFYAQCAEGCTDPVNECDADMKGVRGGAMATYSKTGLAVFLRGGSGSSRADYMVGFRCARPYDK